MTEWFYVRGGQQFGPISFEQLVALARSGDLAPTDGVWTDKMSGWTPANQVPGIFDAAPASTPADAMPPSMPPSMAAANPYAAPQSNWRQPVADLPEGGVLSEIAPGSEPLDPVECIKRGFDLTKRQFGPILLVGIVYFACIMVPSFIFSFIDAMAKGTSPAHPELAHSPGGAALFLLAIFQILLQIFSLFLKLGMVRVGLEFVSGNAVHIGLLFGEGSKLLRAVLATILFSIAVVIGLVLLIVPGIYIALRYGQYLNAIVDRDLGIMESFSYSESITTNNRVNLLLLGFLGFLVALAGMLACFIGLIFAGPVVWLASMVAYRWMQYGREASLDHPGTEEPMLRGI